MKIYFLQRPFLLFFFHSQLRKRMTAVLTRAQMEKYYDFLFPISFVLKFLSHGSVDGAWSMKRREIVVTLPKIGLEDTFKVRYGSVANEAEWRDFLLRNKNFLQLDVGGVFYLTPKRMSEVRGPFSLDEAVNRRELTFDVDMSDYDDVRFCCQKKTCCVKCWPLAVAAAAFLDAYLREAYACHKLVWLFSGRRGIHCWVYDEKCARAKPSYRSEIVDFISNERQRLRSGADPLPYIMATARNLQVRCDKFIAEQRLLADADRRRAFFADLDLPASVAERWINAPCVDLDALAGIVSVDDSAQSRGRAPTSRKYLALEVLLKCMSPRIDRAVTVDRAHLIKLPFSLHPTTGNICMPVTLEQLAALDPQSKVFHAAQCTRELIDAAIASVNSAIE